MSTKTKLLAHYVLKSGQLQAIGCVVVELTYLEHYLEFLVWKLVGIEDWSAGRTLTDRLGIGQKLAIVFDLGFVRLKTDDERKQWSNLQSTIKRLIDERNLIVHGVWVHPAIGRVRTDRPPNNSIARRRRAKGERVFSALEIERVAEEIDRVRTQLTLFVGPHLKLHSVADLDKE